MYTKIQKEINKIRRKYLDSAEEIVSSYEREKQLSKDYEGRQIFELLQNADDASENTEGKVLITFENNKLTVSNTGEKFSFEGFKSLLYPNVSPKRIRANKIGCKGLGFRSILTWTDSVVVATEDFSIQFSKNDAIDFLNGILEEKNSLKDELKILTEEKWPIATLTSPRLLNYNALVEGYDTSIVMECHAELADDIESQIESLEFEELIFLPNLKEIEIICGDYHKTFFKVIEGNNISIEETDNKTNEREEAFWKIYKKTGQVIDENGDEKDYEFIIAYDPEGKHYGEVLYSFFKTEVQLFFPALIHGTFVLTSERNKLEKKNVVNNQLIPLLADFMVDTAVKISEEQDECDYRPLSLIITTENGIDLSLRNEYSFDKLLKDKAREKRVLPTIKNQYISVNDNPYFSWDNFAEVLNPDVFPTLLKNTDSKVIRDYIMSDLGITFYDYEDFCNLINGDMDHYPINYKAWLIMLIENVYSDYDENDEPSVFPHLIVDTNGETIASAVKVFPFPSEEQVISLPSWVNVRFLNQDLEQELYEYYDDSYNRRQLVSDLSRYNLEEYSFDRLLRSVVNQFDEDSLTKEKCTDILNWLWQYYCQDENRQPVPDVKIKVLCRDGVIREAKECYIGKEYDNELGERLISLYSKNFVALEELHIDCKDRKMIAQFLEWIGLSKYPRILKKTLKGKERTDFLDYCYPLYVASDSRFYQINEFYYPSTVVVGSIENMEILFSGASFNDILAWFLLDNEINIRLNTDTEEKNSYSYIKGYPARAQYERTVTPPYIKSYLRYVLSNTEWIENLDGVKRKPEYCCFEENNELEPLIIVPSVDYSYIKKIIGRNCKKEVDGILSRIGVADVFQEMKKNIIYETLMFLPKLDPYCKKARTLYRKIVREGLEPEEYAENNPFYDDFLKSGSVAVRKNGTKFYAPIERVYYSDKKIFSEEILKNFNMFDMDARSGEEKIRKLFGVSPLKYSNIELEGQPVLHPLQTIFKNEYAAYIPFVYACRIGFKKADQDYRSLKTSKVILCSNVKVKYKFDDEFQISELKDYEIVYFRKKNTAYICAPKKYNLVSELKQDFEFADAIAEIITSILDVNDDKGFFRDLFSDSDIKREQRMRTDKGDDNLELLTEARQKFNSDINLRDEFWRTIAEIKRLNKISISTSSADDIIAILKLSFDIDKDIKYEDVNGTESIEALIPIFKKLEIDLDLFNGTSVRSIDASNYWTSKLINKMNAYRNKYQAYIVNYYKNEDNCIELYDQCMEDYDYPSPNIEKSLFVNIDEVFERECGVSFAELEKYDDDTIIRMLEDAKKSIKSEDYERLKLISSSQKIEAYLLFGRINELLNPMVEDETGITSNDIKNSNNVSDLIREIMSTPSDGFESVRLQSSITGNTKDGTKRRKKPKMKHSESTERRKLEIGAIGEAAVYKELKSLYPDAKWISGNAQDAGFTIKGDDTCGYDIKYTDENNNVQYVEVKSSSDDEISFEISHGELRFACEHAANYEVIFAVIGDDQKLKRKPYRLGHLFDFIAGEDLLNNSIFSIESEKYHIFAEKTDQYK